MNKSVIALAPMRRLCEKAGADRVSDAAAQEYNYLFTMEQDGTSYPSHEARPQ